MPRTVHSPEIFARSLDGIWTFDGDHIFSAEATVEPHTIDFFERWTFARFLPGPALAFGFESSQPWSEYGSYGDRYGGVQVMALTKPPSEWSLVAMDYDIRSFNEEFIPLDVTWHSVGVLAWLVNECLEIQLAKEARDNPLWQAHPLADRRPDLVYQYEFVGSWKRLDLSARGDILTAVDAEGLEFFDLVHKRRSRDGSTWEPWDDCGSVY